MKLKICFMAALCLIFKVQAQPKISHAGLNIGDSVPDVMITKILNYPGGSARVSDFKDKLLILDFWATWCVPCVSHLPEMYDIQKEFKDQVFVLLVSQRKNRDTEAGIRDFLQMRKKFYQFPSVVQDTILEKLFPHGTIPHYAFIKNNKVLAITDAEQATVANVRLLLANDQVKLQVKKNIRIKPDLPFFENGNGGQIPDNFYRSTLTGRIDVANTPLGFQTNEKGSVIKINAVNLPLPYLYTFSYPEFAQFTDVRMLFQVGSQAEALPEITGTAGLFKRQYTYEAIIPPISKDAALRIMRQDLYRYFNLIIESQLRDTTCYVLRLNSEVHPNAFKDGDKKILNISEKLQVPKYSHGYPPASIAAELEDLFRLPFFDETGYTLPVKLDLPANISDLRSLSASLKKQGFMLIQKKRKVAYMVFRQDPLMP